MVRTVVTPAKKKNKSQRSVCLPYGIPNELGAGPSSAGYLRRPQKSISVCILWFEGIRKNESLHPQIFYSMEFCLVLAVVCLNKDF